MALMAKKKPNVPETSEDRHTTPRVVFHLPEELLRDLDQIAQRNDRTRTAEIIRAIRKHVRDERPPPAKE